MPRTKFAWGKDEGHALILARGTRSQQELAHEMGLSVSCVARLELGKVHPARTTVAKILAVLPDFVVREEV